ncbi:LTA synthase family protein [Clostridium sp. BJN0001]|uniref:LTA synthase family protein n=1 Tax=Clostridium sp. BJN0001 TaxID=2930219 RepID=UPI001FD49400|nr:LTA synthase family protein [Clostridium sp. BJN0001]
MKQRLKILIPFLLSLIIMIKSWLFLSMLRTDGASHFDLHNIYFTMPAYWAHILMAIMLASICFLFRNKKQITCFIIIDILITIILLLDIWYFRTNAGFLSIKHLLGLRIFNPVEKSIINFRLIDIVFIIDFIIFIILYILGRKNNSSFGIHGCCKIHPIILTVILILSTIIIAFTHNTVDKNDSSNYILFKESWAPFQQMSNMSPIGYHVYDVFETLTTNEKTVLNTEKASQSDIEDIDKWFEENKEDLKDNEFKGIYKDNNVIYIQVESLENWVINEKVYGQEITPNLNKLLNNSLYFDNIYHQNKTSFSADADLMANASILTSNGRPFYDYPTVTLNSMAKVLSKEGYEAISTHPETAGGWNWAESHRGALGVNNIWTVDDFNIDEKIGLGISDGSYLKQVSEKLEKLNNPYYAFLVTISSHGDFDIPKQYRYLDLPEDFDSTIAGSYCQAIRYTDEQIGKFIESLKENGSLDNTTIVIYGDHTILHRCYKNQIEEMSIDGPWKADEEKIPLIVYNPKTEGQVIEKNGGLVDVMPTVLYLLGNDRQDIEKTCMGRILVNTDRDSTIVFTGKIAGDPKTDEERQHLNDAYSISEKIFRNNYFKVKGY